MALGSDRDELPVQLKLRAIVIIACAHGRNSPYSFGFLPRAAASLGSACRVRVQAAPLARAAHGIMQSVRQWNRPGAVRENQPRRATPARAP